MCFNYLTEISDNIARDLMSEVTADANSNTVLNFNINPKLVLSLQGFFLVLWFHLAFLSVSVSLVEGGKKWDFKFSSQPHKHVSEVIFSVVTQTYTCWSFYFSRHSSRWEPITGHRSLLGKNSITSFHWKMEYRNKSWLELKSCVLLLGANKYVLRCGC